jgi:predicted NBD/HSP70 family sugar kinase
MTVSLPSAPVVRWPGLPDGERRVLLELLRHGAQPRARIAERLQLSRTSLTRTTRALLDAGLITEGDTVALGSRGRPAETLHLRPEAAHVVGVKLTADTLYLVVTDLGARIVTRSSVPLPSRSVDEVVALIGSLVPVDLDVIAGIGIAVAGDVTPSADGGVLHRSTFLGWDSVPLARLVTAATGLPATVVNDVHALAGAQHWFGGERHRSMVVFGVGAGIGAGVVLDDDLHGGAHGRAGRVGHTRIGGRGRRCENGHTDCVHSFVTIPAIEHNAGAGVGAYSAVLARARSGDDSALHAFRLAARALGAVIADAVNAFDPEVVAVMGEGVDMIDLHPDALRSSLAEHLEQGDPGAVVVDRPAFDFALYARGAAVAVMREVLA